VIAQGVRRVVAIGVCATAVASVIAGALRTHTTIYEQPVTVNAPAIVTPGGVKLPTTTRTLPPKIITETVAERQLVIDATFTGVLLKDGKLMTQYDRTKPGGRRACPT
jgi:hypothetical protein